MDKRGEKYRKNVFFRISLFYWLVYFIGLCIVIQIINLNYFAKAADGERYAAKAKRVSVRRLEVKPERGDILAHDGTLLATSLETYTLYMDFLAEGLTDSLFNKNVAPLSKSLSAFFKDKTASQYETKLKDLRKRAIKYRNEKKYRVGRIADQKVNYLELQQILKFPLLNLGANKSGFIPESDKRRAYLYKGLAYRTIGYMNADGGGVGIEYSFNKELEGDKGFQMAVRGSNGNFIPFDSNENVKPKGGCDVVSTLDIDIQDIAESALRAQLMKVGGYFEAGTAVVMDVSTGEIRAMANMKRESGGTFSEKYNYAIAEATEPGSTFKLASLLAVLEKGKLKIDDVIECGNKWEYRKKSFVEANGGSIGRATVQKIIEKSSNIGTAKMVVRSFEGVESEFINYLHKLKLNEPMGIEIQGEAKPEIKSPKSTMWRPSSMPIMAIGYEVKLAPIHTLTLYNAVANGGKMVRPRLIKEIRRNGKSVKTYKTEVINDQICSKSTLAEAQKILEGVVEEGTARRIKSSKYTIAGKTGTSQIAFGSSGYYQNGMKRNQVTFCGYFPANNPKYSCIVVLYTRLIPKDMKLQSASWATPIFKEISDKIYASHPQWELPLARAEAGDLKLPATKNGNEKELSEVVNKLNMPVKKNKTDSEWVLIGVKDNKIEFTDYKVSDKQMPSVIGMGLKDAVLLLESIGLQVNFTGKGSVKSQSIEAGKPFKNGQTVSLQLAL